MANTQAQFGFQHFGYLPGGAPDYAQSTPYQIQSSFSTKIWFGDPVIKQATSKYMNPATGTGNLTAIAGIFVGCVFTPSSGLAVPQWSPWWPGAAAADATAYVIDAPNALFRVAALLTAVPATAIGQNIGFSTGAGGTAVGQGFSTFTVDQGTLTTGPTAPFQVYSLFPGIGNGSDPTTNYNWVIVTFNQQRFRAGATGVA
jgi:hypothetical protein